ncbi:unnamed protein product [Symbiodinium sp. KB8]|nr:unnamed protein product [Symbiodinium sp. KB8]
MVVDGASEEVDFRSAFAHRNLTFPDRDCDGIPDCVDACPDDPNPMCSCLGWLPVEEVYRDKLQRFIKHYIDNPNKALQLLLFLFIPGGRSKPVSGCLCFRHREEYFGDHHIYGNHPDLLGNLVVEPDAVNDLFDHLHIFGHQNRPDNNVHEQHADHDHHQEQHGDHDQKHDCDIYHDEKHKDHNVDADLDVLYHTDPDNDNQLVCLVKREQKFMVFDNNPDVLESNFDDHQHWHPQHDGDHDRDRSTLDNPFAGDPFGTEEATDGVADRGTRFRVYSYLTSSLVISHLLMEAAASTVTELVDFLVRAKCTTLHACELKLFGAAAERVAIALAANTSVRTLRLNECDVDNKVGSLLAEALEENRCLRVLSLCRNRIGPAGAAKLAEVLRTIVQVLGL